MDEENKDVKGFPSSVDATPTPGQGSDSSGAEPCQPADPVEALAEDATQALRQWVRDHPLTALTAAFGLGLVFARLAQRH